MVCRGICANTGYNLTKWKVRGRVKCSTCNRAFDDDGQMYCSCCSNKVSRRVLRTAWVMPRYNAYIKEWEKKTKKGELM